ncbi:nuclear transcription factor Y subunit C-6-like [Carex rostrata]
MEQKNPNSASTPTGPPPVLAYPAAATAAPFAPYAHLYPPQPHLPQPHQPAQPNQQLQLFWADQYREIEQVADFKNHNLPLARIKKIMKADEDVRMIAAEAPVVFARACEMFILELTHRGWAHAEENKRRTLQKSDIAAAISRTDVFDFLVDIVPREEGKEEGLTPRAHMAAAASVPTPDQLGAYYYVPQ